MIFFVILQILKKLKSIISGLIWTLLLAYSALIILTHIPPVQSFIGLQVSQALEKKLGTRVIIGKVNLGFLNRIIIDDVTIYDQQQKKMLSAGRMSAKFDYIPLTQGRVVISSAQLFGLRANLYKTTADAKPNFQFVLDSLASKDTTSHKPLDLAIHSLIIRHGDFAYRQLDKAPSEGKFSPTDLQLSNLSTHLILNCLRDDSINFNLKTFSVKEKSGLAIKSLSFTLTANKQGAVLNKFALSLPHSNIKLGRLTARYQYNKGKITPGTLSFSGGILPSTIVPVDLAVFVPQLKSLTAPLNVDANFHGTDSSVSISYLTISSRDNSLMLRANGFIRGLGAKPTWAININPLRISGDGIQNYAQAMGDKLKVPAVVTRLGSIAFKGQVAGRDKQIATKGLLTTDAGKADLDINLNNSLLSGKLSTDDLNLRRLLDNEKFGTLALDVTFKGTLPKKEGESLLRQDITAKADISRFDYNDYTFRNMAVNGTMHNALFNGTFTMKDPNADVDLEGKVLLDQQMPIIDITAAVNHINPSALRLSNKYPGATFAFNTKANVKGKDLHAMDGLVDITDFVMRKKEETFGFDQLHVQANTIGKEHRLELTSDFANLNVRGQYDYVTLPQTIANLIGRKLPTLPGLKWNKETYHNNFTVNGQISDTEFLRQFFNVPLKTSEPVSINGAINEDQQQINLVCQLPAFNYNGTNYRDGYLAVTSPSDSLKAHAKLVKINDNGKMLSLDLNANAADNNLSTLLNFDTNSDKHFKGSINAVTQFFKSNSKQNAAHITLHPSKIFVSDTTWNVEPSDIIYEKNKLIVDHLSVGHQQQHIAISGMGTPNSEDSLIVDLKDVDVAYVLDLVNFHSVDFDGRASGRGRITSLFGKPEASAHLTVDDFTFSEGRMGQLTAKVNWNRQQEQIDIDAIAKDTMMDGDKVITDKQRLTFVKGYVSPKRNDIDLEITAKGSRAEFLDGFCSSFMTAGDLYVDGKLNLVGKLNKLNLVGKVMGNGTAYLKPLNCTYNMRQGVIQLDPDEIKFCNDTLLDDRQHTAILTGSLRHENLRHLTYDLQVKANDLRMYNWDGTNGDTFYGTVFGTGNCTIAGGNGETDINVNITPQKGTEIVYNAAAPSGITSNDFIHWSLRDSVTTSQPGYVSDSVALMPPKGFDIPSDVHINFLIHTNPSAALKVIMDNKSGDYIRLFGEGTLRASYYNKGAFNIFGNYAVDDGIYKLTIQNIIRREFIFTHGGVIAFGGDPYDAALNLKAKYIVNAASLSDLNLGNSFSSNTVRVECLMNINGTPKSPQVSFDLDMPTVGQDAKQMIMSIINGDEEKNQQVLYLLAVGRFYSQGVNNSVAENSSRQGQTSLAMQSILSGQISQQINTLLGNVINNSNWNFGANISTGDEGWNNAEYEGLVSGRLFNNRLIFNGQFGYRDKANATTSFIGDFDLRYLLKPNGNFSLRVYNQANDRYFTKSNLNTQGLGLILKKDFYGLRDLFGLKKKAKKEKK